MVNNNEDMKDQEGQKPEDEQLETSEEPRSEQEAEEAAQAGEAEAADASGAASQEEAVEPQEEATTGAADEDPRTGALPDEPEVEIVPPSEPLGGQGQLRGIAAFFEHPKHLLAAATHARDAEYKDFDAYSPFPIHGMDEAMGLGRSWIPWVTFGAGLTGFILANAMQFGMLTFDWPMIIGGKPFAPWPSFVPIMFELTVLLAGVTTAVVMLKAAGCFQKPTIIDPSITDDRFVLWISAEDTKFDEGEVSEFLANLNPLEVRKIVKDA